MDKKCWQPGHRILINSWMGQQSNKIQKRNRRKEYLKRKKKSPAAVAAATPAPAKAAKAKK